MQYSEIHALPAYGRDYKSKAKLLEDWNANKDFVINDMSSKYDRCYINKQQVAELKKDGYTHIHFRYKKLASLTTLEI